MLLRTSCLFFLLTWAGFLWFVSCSWCWTLIGGHVLSLSSCHRIIFFPIIICIKKLLKPLHKLKVILKLALHKLVNRNNLQRCKMLQISYTTHIVHYEYILCSKMERMLCVLMNLTGWHTLLTPIFLKLPWMSLKLWMYSCSSLAWNLTFFSGIHDGNSMSMNWQ